MERPCEYSVLTIPNDPSYISVGVAYVAEVARKIGFQERDEKMIQTAVTQAIGNVIDQRFDPDERADLRISCERVPLGLKVVVKDRGLPVDIGRLEQCPVLPDVEGESGPCRGISVMRDSMDEVAFNYRGPEGNEIVLVKYLNYKSITDYLQACSLEPFASVATQERSAPVEVTIRAMDPPEAIEVSRNMYRTYEYSYSYEHVYYPDRIADLCESGDIYVAVAVTPDGEIVGNCALIRGHGIGPIAEIGMGAVKPTFRGQGILTRLSKHIFEKAESEHLMGILGQAVTLHTYSQKTGHALGLKDCAIALAYVPADVVFRGIRERLLQRDTLVVQFRYIHKPRALVIHPPQHHRDIIVTLYNHLGMMPRVVSADSIPDHAVEPTVRTMVPGIKGLARIIVEGYGPNVVHEVKARLRDLCVKQAEVIHLYLDLSDPGTARYCQEFETLGFFFAGILPGGCAGDALILQYLNNIALNYGRINLQSDLAKTLLSYVKARDPYRQ